MADAVALKPGTPSWVDLGSPNLDESAKFYSSLFGWKANVSESPEANGYTMFLNSDGKEVAGGAPLQDPNQPPAWTTYVSVDDAKGTADKAEKAGGKVLMAPMQVMEAGTMAILQDPTGAVIALWQPGTHLGAEVYNAPGAMCWNELATRDTAAAGEFYKSVFDWDTKTQGEGADAYTEFGLDGKSIAGMIDATGKLPDTVRANWLTYFAVDDCQGAADKVTELGGQVRMGPTPSPFGPFAVVADPHGAVFAVVQMS